MFVQVCGGDPTWQYPVGMLLKLHLKSSKLFQLSLRLNKVRLCCSLTWLKYIVTKDYVRLLSQLNTGIVF